jgi:hypothetical protein
VQLLKKPQEALEVFKDRWIVSPYPFMIDENSFD